MIVCGIDEVGRGALAGPIVGAAVWCEDAKLADLKLKDSKKLSRLSREKLYQQLINLKITHSIYLIEVEEINRYGIGWANKELFRILIGKSCGDVFILDGNLKIEHESKLDVKSVVKADQKFPQVMAASIIAKVYRDKLMKELHAKFPQYYWADNVGYGTSKHISAIVTHGACELHRRVFVKTVLQRLGV